MGFMFGLCVYLYPLPEHTRYLLITVKEAAGIGIMSGPFTSGFWIPYRIINRFRYYVLYKEKLEKRIAKLQAVDNLPLAQ